MILILCWLFFIVLVTLEDIKNCVLETVMHPTLKIITQLKIFEISLKMCNKHIIQYEP